MLTAMSEDNSWRGLTYWERVKWARINAGFKKAAHASRALGIEDPDTYSAYERNPKASKHTRLTMDRAQQFAAEYGVRWQWLLDDNDKGSPFEQDDPGTTQWQRIQRALRDATPEQQEQAADVIEALMRRAANS